jgi:hypothetical protein
MRRQIAIACCCGLLLAVGWAFGQQNLSASKWAEYGKADKFARMMHLKGYLDGYNDGDSAMEKIASVLMKGNSPDPATKNLVAAQVVRIAQVAGLGVNHNITVGGIETAMDAFYDDYRNAPVCWKDALQFSIWSLNGDASTEKELDAARKHGADDGCK